MIIKPEDAEPNYSIDEGCSFFSLSECAQIARAYAQAVVERGDISARKLNASFIPETADVWEAKFAEWEKAW